MKRLIACNILLLASFATMAEVDPSSGVSGDASKPAAAVVMRHVRVQVSFYALGSGKLSAVMNPPAGTTTSAYDRIQSLVAAEDAKLVNMTLLSCQSGERATCESFREIIYPTEIDPDDHLPPTVGGGLGSPLPLPLRPYTATPTAFETRNVGETLQIEPSFTGPSGQPINLRVVHEMITHARNTVWMKYRDQWGTANTSFPEFDTQRTVSNLTLSNHQTQFLNSYTPNRPDGKPDRSRKIIVFVKLSEVRP